MIFNKNYFESLADYDIMWSLWKDGVCISKPAALPIQGNTLKARERKTVTLPFDPAKLEAASEYFVKIQFVLKADKPWAEKGYVQMDEQLPVKAADITQSVYAGGSTLQKPVETADGITVTLVEGAKRKGVSRSTIFRMTKDGTLPTVCIRGKNRIRLGDLERAFAPSAIKVGAK